MFWVYLPISLIGQLLAYPLVPIAVIFADADGRLPRFLRWLETHDALGWLGPMSEPAVAATVEKYGKRIGLIRWLWRNKVYTLRHWMRARITDDMPRNQSGQSVPARWGYSSWSGRIGPYWEWQPRFGFGGFHVYLRCGWKMKPYFDSDGPYMPSAGIFTGVGLRTDDWDDYEGA